jgi:hypothetical protein
MNLRFCCTNQPANDAYGIDKFMLRIMTKACLICRICKCLSSCTYLRCRMPSSVILHCVALVRTDVWEELSASIIRVTRIDELGTTLAVTSNRSTLWRNTKVRRLLVTASVVPSSQILVTLMMEALSSSETSVLTRATRCHIPEHGILHSHRSENLKSYIELTGWAL